MALVTINNGPFYFQGSNGGVKEVVVVTTAADADTYESTLGNVFGATISPKLNVGAGDGYGYTLSGTGSKTITIQAVGTTAVQVTLEIIGTY